MMIGTRVSLRGRHHLRTGPRDVRGSRQRQHGVQLRLVCPRLRAARNNAHLLQRAPGRRATRVPSDAPVVHGQLARAHLLR